MACSDGSMAQLSRRPPRCWWRFRCRRTPRLPTAALKRANTTYQVDFWLDLTGSPVPNSFSWNWNGVTQSPSLQRCSIRLHELLVTRAGNRNILHDRLQLQKRGIVLAAGQRGRHRRPGTPDQRPRGGGTARHCCDRKVKDQAQTQCFKLSRPGAYSTGPFQVDSTLATQQQTECRRNARLPDGDAPGQLADGDVRDLLVRARVDDRDTARATAGDVELHAVGGERMFHGRCPTGTVATALFDARSITAGCESRVRARFARRCRRARSAHASAPSRHGRR